MVLEKTERFIPTAAQIDNLRNSVYLLPLGEAGLTTTVEDIYYDTEDY